MFVEVIRVQVPKKHTKSMVSIVQKTYARPHNLDITVNLCKPQRRYWILFRARRQ